MSLHPMTSKFDERDQAILDARIALYDAIAKPRVGDYVIFADDVTRRISHVWDWDDDDPEYPPVAQTSDGGSWYLGDGYQSFSGSLWPGVKLTTLTLTDETRRGACWFFHHDWHRAHNGVDITIPQRVYRCSLPAPR